MIETIDDLMEAPKAPHLQRLLEFLLDGYTFESAKRKVVNEVRRKQPLFKWDGDREEICPCCKESHLLSVNYHGTMYCSKCGSQKWQDYNDSVTEAMACGYL